MSAKAFFKSLNSSPLRRILNHSKLTSFRKQYQSTMTTEVDIETCKIAAAYRAVDENLTSNCRYLGIGSGSTIVHVIKRVVQKIDEENLTLSCIPTSFQSKQLLHQFKVPVVDINYIPHIDLTIDGADEVDRNLVAIKGGGACLLQEKIVAHRAKKFVVVADYRKHSNRLGDKWNKGIPVEVSPFAFEVVKQSLSRILEVSKEDIKLRDGGDKKAGPVITDNGNFILDCAFNADFDLTSNQWKDISTRINDIPGVFENGLFTTMIESAYFGLSDGRVKVVRRDQ